MWSHRKTGDTCVEGCDVEAGTKHQLGLSDLGQFWRTVAIGDFLDEWRRSSVEERGQLIQEEMTGWDDAIQLIQWAAFCAAMVEWL